jgi:MFS family permease
MRNYGMHADPQPPADRSLAAFAVPNFRRFVTGQTISLVGSWTETVAQAVLVLRLTHSGVWLGLATAARYGPVLLLPPYAGVIVDRRTKRGLLLLTQSSLAGASLLLGVLVLSGAIRLWMVFAVALVFGTLTALDNPARLAFISKWWVSG